MRTSTFFQLLVSHVLVFGLGFQFGVISSVTQITTYEHPDAPGNHSLRVQSYNDDNNTKCQTIYKNHDETKDTKPSHLRLPEGLLSEEFSKRIFHGATWIPRKNFVKQFDIGFPFESKGTDEHSVLLLHASQESLPTSYTNTQSHLLSTIEDSAVATENCENIYFMVIDDFSPKSCIAVAKHWSVICLLCLLQSDFSITSHKHAEFDTTGASQLMCTDL